MAHFPKNPLSKSFREKTALHGSDLDHWLQVVMKKMKVPARYADYELLLHLLLLNLLTCENGQTGSDGKTRVNPFGIFVHHKISASTLSFQCHKQLFVQGPSLSPHGSVEVGGCSVLRNPPSSHTS